MYPIKTKRELLVMFNFCWGCLLRKCNLENTVAISLATGKTCPATLILPVQKHWLTGHYTQQLLPDQGCLTWQCNARRQKDATWVRIENRGLFRMKQYAHAQTTHDLAVSLGIQKRSSISLTVNSWYFPCLSQNAFQRMKAKVFHSVCRPIILFTFIHLGNTYWVFTAGQRSKR